MRLRVDEHDRRGAVVDPAGVARRHGAVLDGRPAAAGPAARRSTRPGAGRRRPRPRRRRSRRRSRRTAGCANARACERAAYSSCSSRLTPRARAKQVVGQPHLGIPMRGRRERRPLVAHRAPRRRAGGQNRHGAVDTDSTPPARTTPRSERSVAAAVTTAASPLAHWRSTVSAGTLRPEAGLQRGDPGDVAAGSHAVAEHHLVDVAVRPAREVGEHRRRQVGGGQGRQRTTGGADRGASRGDDHRVRRS